ncbi:MAG: hypothetical protein ABEI13_03740 [Candidatus Paceibacteria bacterium]
MEPKVESEDSTLKIYNKKFSKSKNQEFASADSSSTSESKETSFSKEVEGETYVNEILANEARLF